MGVVPVKLVFTLQRPTEPSGNWFYAYRETQAVSPFPLEGLNHFLNPLPLRGVEEVLIDATFPVQKLGHSAWEMVHWLVFSSGLNAPVTIAPGATAGFGQTASVAAGPWAAAVAGNREVTVDNSQPWHSHVGLYTAFQRLRDSLPFNLARGEPLRTASPEVHEALTPPDTSPWPPPRRLKKGRLLDSLTAGSVQPIPLSDADFEEWAAVDREGWFHRLPTYARSWQSYLIARGMDKAGAIVKALLALDRASGQRIEEHAANAATVLFQVVSDPRTNFSSAHATDIDIACAYNFHAIAAELSPGARTAFSFQAADVHHYSFSQRASVVIFCHCLLYFDRTHLENILRKAYLSLDPPGALVVYENTSPPQSREAGDGPLLLSADELHSTLRRATGSEPHCFDPATGEPSDLNSSSKHGALMVVPV